MNPLADNPLETREQHQRAVRDLYEPLRSHTSPGEAWVNPGHHGAHYPEPGVAVEGFARPLWGIAPLGAGGGAFDHWDRIREGLRNGTDPEHAEYWGAGGDYDQVHVERPAIALAIALVPEAVWEPLRPEERDRLADWLAHVNEVDLHPNNWLYFRVLTNLGLREVGVEIDEDGMAADLDRLEGYYRADGWYTDGPDGPMDYYNPWAMHFYGLLYGALAGGRDPARAERFRDRAERFAEDFAAWFRPDGAALPYGRSLTYRFAQASFWGALAFADLPALDWSVIRGLWQRNVQWWAERSIFSNDGGLTVGYAYPNIGVMEPYNSPSAPYWAMKAFLPLALDSDHPFWRSEPAPLPEQPAVSCQPEPGMVLSRTRDDTVALVAGHSTRFPEKYAKHAYSTRFGFSVGSRRTGLGGAGHDGTLALSTDEEDWRVPAKPDRVLVSEQVIHRRSSPWDDVDVDTWLMPAPPWHARVHRIETERSLHLAAGGFPVARPERLDSDPVKVRSEAGLLAAGPNGASGIRLVAGDGEPTLVDQDPNTNVRTPRTSVPTIHGSADRGTTWLCVGATGGRDPDSVQWEGPPLLEELVQHVPTSPWG